MKNKFTIFTKIFILILAIFLLACSKQEPRLKYLSQSAVILAFGDSLTYGSGAPSDMSYPTVLEKIINRQIINAGVSGLQTAEGLQQISQLLEKYQPSLVILCLGGNDMLSRKKIEDVAKHIDQIVHTILTSGSEVVLISVPRPGLGLSPPDFYKIIAEKYNIPLDNETLSELEGDGKYKSDYIHLNGEGYKKLAESIAELLKNSGAI